MTLKIDINSWIEAAQICQMNISSELRAQLHNAQAGSQLFAGLVVEIKHGDKTTCGVICKDAIELLDDELRLCFWWYKQKEKLVTKQRRVAYIRDISSIKIIGEYTGKL